MAAFVRDALAPQADSLQIQPATYETPNVTPAPAPASSDDSHSQVLDGPPQAPPKMAEVVPDALESAPPAVTPSASPEMKSEEGLSPESPAAENHAVSPAKVAGPKITS